MSAAGGLVNHPSSTTPLKAAGGSSANHKGFSEKPAFQGEVTKRCFICGSKTHLKYDCPDRNKSGTSYSNVKVNTCQVQKQSNCETLCAPMNVEKRNQSIQTVDAEIKVCAESNTAESYNNEFYFVDTDIIELNNIEYKKYVLWNVYLPNALHSVCLNRLCAKCEVSSFNRSRDMEGVPKF